MSKQSPAPSVKGATPLNQLRSRRVMLVLALGLSLLAALGIAAQQPARKDSRRSAPRAKAERVAAQANFSPATPAKEYIYAGGKLLATVEGLEPGAAPQNDFSGDGNTDFTVWRPGTGFWYVFPGVIQKQWGASGDIPVPGDYDGDGKTDFAVWRGLGGGWHIIQSRTGQVQSTYHGGSEHPWRDVPVPADYDGDGRADIAVWRRGPDYEGTWYIIQSSNGVGRTQHWGQDGDIPVPGDYDGDGKTDIAVWRRGYAMWYVFPGVIQQQWGGNGDIPVPGDYDGDGKTDFAVWRPATGVWWIINSSNGVLRSQQWGSHGDVPIGRLILPSHYQYP